MYIQTARGYSQHKETNKEDVQSQVRAPTDERKKARQAMSDLEVIAAYLVDFSDIAAGGPR